MLTLLAAGLESIRGANHPPGDEQSRGDFLLPYESDRLESTTFTHFALLEAACQVKKHIFDKIATELCRFTHILAHRGLNERPTVAGTAELKLPLARPWVETAT